MRDSGIVRLASLFYVALSAFGAAGPPPSGGGGTGQSYTISSFVTTGAVYRLAQAVTDSAGNTYVTGSSMSGNGSRDALVAKLDATGKTIFAVTFGGSGDDEAAAIAVDESGNVYAGGSSASADFPLLGALQTSGCANCSGRTGFVAKLDSTGKILYSTYFGGTAGVSAVTALAVDSAGSLFAAGSTTASDFPHTPGLPAGMVNTNGVPQVAGAFFAEISANGNQVLASGVLTGQSTACGGGSSCFLQTRTATASSIALDAQGHLYLAGNTNTTDLAAASRGGGPVYLGKGVGPFVARIDLQTGALTLTYLSAASPLGSLGTSASSLSGLALDAAGDVYLAGSTSDVAFPVTAGAYQTVLNRASASLGFVQADAFAVRLTGDLSRIVWATYLGDSGLDRANAVSVDGAGVVWLAGQTNSPHFPNQNGFIQGGDFLAGLNAAGTALTYAAQYPAGTVGQSVAAGAPGEPHTAGLLGLVTSFSTAITNGPLNVFVVQNAASALAREQLAPGEIFSLYGQNIGGASVTGAPGAGGLFPASLGGVQVLVNGIAAPLLYVSPGQINAVVPLRATGATASIQVINASRTTAVFYAPLAASAPGIFRIDETHAIVLNEDGTLNSAAHPAPAGSAAAIWATGVTPLDPALVDGEVQPGAVNTACCTIDIGQKTAAILYAGDAPATVTGLEQVNFRVPPGNASPEQTLALHTGGETDTLLIYVQ